jgi:Tol biopolymer transport system component
MQVWSGRKLPTDVDEDPRPGRNGFGCAPGALSASGSRTFDHTYGRALVAGRQPRRVRCSRRLLTAGQRPDWSPDGTTIVYDHFNAWGLPPTSAIWAVNADGTGARLLAADAARPNFSPGGARIAFQRECDIWSMNADESGQQRLTDAPEPDVVPRWSPNGRRIAFLRGSSPYRLYVMNADGSRDAQIAPSSGSELDPDWSPNGKTIAYTRCSSINPRSCRVAFANVGTST